MLLPLAELLHESTPSPGWGGRNHTGYRKQSWGRPQRLSGLVTYLFSTSGPGHHPTQGTLAAPICLPCPRATCSQRSSCAEHHHGNSRGSRIISSPTIPPPSLLDPSPSSAHSACRSPWLEACFSFILVTFFVVINLLLLMNDHVKKPMPWVVPHLNIPSCCLLLLPKSHPSSKAQPKNHLLQEG